MEGGYSHNAASKGIESWSYDELKVLSVDVGDCWHKRIKTESLLIRNSKRIKLPRIVVIRLGMHVCHVWIDDPTI